MNSEDTVGYDMTLAGVQRRLSEAMASVEHLRHDIGRQLDISTTQQQEIERLRAALKDAREFIAGMTRPISPASNPCHGAIDKIDAALANQQSEDGK